MQQRIINAAIKLFENDGIKFTLDDIAAQEGISKKTIYKYFKNKEDVIEKAIDYVFDDISNQHLLIISTDKPLLQKLFEILLVYPHVFQVTAENMKKIIDFYPAVYKLLVMHFNEKWDLTLDLLHQCIDAKIIKPISDTTFKIIMVGIFDTVLQYQNQQEELEKCIKAVFEGLIDTNYEKRMEE